MVSYALQHISRPSSMPSLYKYVSRASTQAYTQAYASTRKRAHACANPHPHPHHALIFDGLSYLTDNIRRKNSDGIIFDGEHGRACVATPLHTAHQKEASIVPRNEIFINTHKIKNKYPSTLQLTVGVNPFFPAGKTYPTLIPSRLSPKTWVQSPKGGKRDPRRLHEDVKCLYTIVTYHSSGQACRRISTWCTVGNRRQPTVCTAANIGTSWSIMFACVAALPHKYPPKNKIEGVHGAERCPSRA